MSEEINIEGLGKAELLAALYNASQQQGMGFLHARGDYGMTVEDARAELKRLEDAGRGPYFDYLHGRVMKVALDGDTFSPRLFDRDNGFGAAAAAIQRLRDEKRAAA